MKAIKVDNHQAVLVDVPEPRGDGVLVKVVSSSICGSDLHMMERGYFGDYVIGHEFAGIAPDGRAVAVEPTLGCGLCSYCEEGHRQHCQSDARIMGVFLDGGMAEYVLAPAGNLVELPTGLDMTTAALVEPLAVAVHTLDRSRLQQGDRVLVIGAGPIGLAVGAALQSRGVDYDISARHEAQRAAATLLGGRCQLGQDYDLVIDAVGSTSSLQQAVTAVRPMGRVGLAGSFWEPAELNVGFCMKEVELIAATTYSCKAPYRNFQEAGELLYRNPEVARALITHRFPLDAVDEAFAAAANRAAGAIKVVFDVA